MDLTTRRALLATTTNPIKTQDYIITQSITIGHAQVDFKYIPDKVILQEEAFSSYAHALFELEDQSVTEKAGLIIEDMNNELVPRWLQLSLYTDQGDSSKHAIIIEDKQPQWENAPLLERMKKI